MKTHKALDLVAVERYINKVIEDSAKAEDRPNDVEWVYKFIDGDLLFCMKSKYIRVMRRIMFRLNNNLQKNFGINFCMLMPDPMKYGNEYWQSKHWDLFEESQGVDPNNSCDYWEVFGKWYTIRMTLGLLEDWELGTPHIDKLQAAGYDWDKQGPGSWDNFHEAFLKVYNKEPLAMALAMKEFYKSGKGQKYNGYKHQYDQAIREEKCGYWFVCSERACPCSPGAPVSQGFDPEVYERMSKDYWKAREEAASIAVSEE